MYFVLFCLHQSCPCFFTRREGGLVVFCVWFYTVLCFDCLHQSCPCFFTRREGGLVIFCVWFYTVLCFVLFASVMSLLLYTERGWPGSILCLVLHCAVFLFCLHQSCPCFFTRREGGLEYFGLVLHLFASVMSLLLYTERGWPGNILFGFTLCCVLFCLHQSCPCFFTRREGGLVVFCVWFYTVLCFCSVCISYVLASLHGERVT